MNRFMQGGKRIVKSIRAKLLRGDKVYCPICEVGFKKFLPYGVVPRQGVLCPSLWVTGTASFAGYELGLMKIHSEYVDEPSSLGALAW